MTRPTPLLALALIAATTLSACVAGGGGQSSGGSLEDQLNTDLDGDGEIPAGAVGTVPAPD